MPIYSPAAWERAMKRHEVLVQAIAGKMTWLQAADVMGLSPRTVRRWRVRMERYGIAGLAAAKVPAAPAEPESAFVALHGVALEDILCHEEERCVARDNTVQLEGVRMQIDKQPGRATCAGLTVTLRRQIDGTHSVLWGKRLLGRYDARGRRLETAPRITSETAA